jgi:hypothetical protein
MTPVSAQQLALWLALNHPDVFVELQRRAQSGTNRSSNFGRLRGLRGFGDDTSAIDTSSIDTSQLETVTVTAQAPDFTSGWTEQDWADLAAANTGALVAPDPSAFIQPVTFDPSVVSASPSDVSSLPAPEPSGPSFLSSLGNAAAGAVSGVAKFLTSPGGLGSLANVAGAFFNSQAQASVLATQVARAQAGQSPAPITYARNAAGQVVPVMMNPQTGAVAIGPNGQPYPVSQSTLQTFQPGATMGAGSQMSAFVQKYWLWILAALGLGIVVSL